MSEIEIKQAEERVQNLDAQSKALRDELKILEGRIANRDPNLIQELKRENELLKKRVVRLQKAVHALYLEAEKHGTDAGSDSELLKESILEFCQKAQIDESLWKNIVS